METRVNTDSLAARIKAAKNELRQFDLKMERQKFRVIPKEWSDRWMQLSWALHLLHEEKRKLERAAPSWSAATP